MLLDVFNDDLVRNIARTCHKVAQCTHLSPPECPAYAFILYHEFPRRFPLEQFYQLTDGDMGKHRYEDMDMILRHMAFHDLQIVALAYFPDETSQPKRYVSTQYWLTIFRDPYDALCVVNGMARFPIMFLTASILKSSHKGEGFSPIPRGRQ